MIKVPRHTRRIRRNRGNSSPAASRSTITLIFSERQYKLARDAVYRGVQRRSDKENVKTVYSIFVSRVDVYTEQHVPTLSADGAGDGRNRERQAHLEDEQGLLGRQGHGAQAGR